MLYVCFICFFILSLLSFLRYSIWFFFLPLFLTVVLQKNHASFFQSPIDRHLVVSKAFAVRMLHWIYTWVVYVYIWFLEIKLVSQRVYVFLILIDTVKLLYAEIVPFCMPNGMQENAVSSQHCCTKIQIPGFLHSDVWNTVVVQSLSCVQLLPPRGL